MSKWRPPFRVIQREALPSERFPTLEHRKSKVLLIYSPRHESRGSADVANSDVSAAARPSFPFPFSLFPFPFSLWILPTPRFTEYIPKPISPPAGPECVLYVLDLYTAARKRNSNGIKSIHIFGAAMAVHPAARYSHDLALLGPGDGL